MLKPFAPALCYNLEGGRRGRERRTPMSVSQICTGASCQSDAGAEDKPSDEADMVTPLSKHRERSSRHWDKSVRIIHAIDFLAPGTLYARVYKHTSYRIDFSPLPPSLSSPLLENLYGSKVEQSASHCQDNSLKTFISGKEGAFSPTCH